jgi:hypothetical protein
MRREHRLGHAEVVDHDEGVEQRQRLAPSLRLEAGADAVPLGLEKMCG